MSKARIDISNYCDLDKFPFQGIFEEYFHAYEVLPDIKKIIAELMQNLSSEYTEIKENIFVGRDCSIDVTATLVGPCIIGSGSNIRAGAYIRENVLLGNKCVVGNSSEIKNSILFNEVQAPHFNYVGDSILGYKSHIGAGVILSNLKSIESTVSIMIDGLKIDTGLRKFGAIIGDHSEVGCNAVLFPGSIIGKNSVIYPLVAFRGSLASNSIVKNKNPIEVITKK
ncbi:UDP-N-acetylglucosamine pyrophosphorylase [Candidatus Riflebacteria bacterium]